MNDFLKASGLVLVGVILCLILSGYGKHFNALISICVCVAVAIAAINYLEPLLDFFFHLQSLGSWNSEVMKILMKAVGIGILSQITSLICADSGNGALGKALQLFSTAIILWLSLPLFKELLELINNLLVNL